MPHLVSIVKNGAEALYGLTVGDVPKVIAGTIKAATSTIPGGTLAHGLVDEVLGNVATPLAENPVVKEVVETAFRTNVSRRYLLDVDHDGDIDLEDAKTATANLAHKAVDYYNSLDSDGNGVVDVPELVHGAIEVASTTKEVLGDVFGEMGAAIDFLDTLDTIASLGG